MSAEHSLGGAGTLSAPHSRLWLLGHLHLLLRLDRLGCDGGGGWGGGSLRGLDVVRAQVLLDVEKRNLEAGRGLEEVGELVVEDDDTTVVRVLEVVRGDIRIDATSNLAAGNHLLVAEGEEGSKLWRNLERAIETVIRSSRLSLLSIGVVLAGAELANELCEGLDAALNLGNVGNQLSKVSHFYTSNTCLL